MQISEENLFSSAAATTAAGAVYIVYIVHIGEMPRGGGGGGVPRMNQLPMLALTREDRHSDYALDVQNEM